MHWILAALEPTPSQSSTSLKQFSVWYPAPTEMVWKAERCGLAFQGRGYPSKSSSLGPPAPEMDLTSLLGFYTPGLLFVTPSASWRQAHWLWLTASVNAHKHPAPGGCPISVGLTGVEVSSWELNLPPALLRLGSLDKPTRSTQRKGCLQFGLY